MIETAPALVAADPGFSAPSNKGAMALVSDPTVNRLEIEDLPDKSAAIQWRIVTTAVVLSGALAAGIVEAGATHGVALLGVGLALGVVLYQAAFGFTSAFRVFVAQGQGAGLRAQLVMLGLASALFFPVLGVGVSFGHHVTGSVAPLNASLAVGAFLFGVGMQLGGGCASGTLYAAGGGSASMFVTMMALIVGSVVGLGHLPFWHALPGLPAISMVKSLGWPLALVGNLLVCGLLWMGVALIERRRCGALRPIASGGSLLRGPWPLLAGAIALAALNFATLLLAGRPWGITSAFGLWGAKLLLLGNVDIGGWGGWAAPGQRAAIVHPVLADINSIMDFGIMIGAMLAAGFAGRYVLFQKIPMRRVLASIIGGFLLGYGARLGYGCNIGAFFDGVASGSLHGWAWIVFALCGTYIGLKLRPLFGMVVERRLTAC